MLTVSFKGIFGADIVTDGDTCSSLMLINDKDVCMHGLILFYFFNDNV